MTTTNDVKELLAEGGQRSATIEEYVKAAKLLTRLRAYRDALLPVVQSFEDPGFRAEWRGRGFAIMDTEVLLNSVDVSASSLDALYGDVLEALADPVWETVEGTVRRSAVPLNRTAHRSTTLCVQDADGEWLVKGTGQLVKGTRQELEAATERWTALSEILPPTHPAEAGTAMGPGVA